MKISLQNLFINNINSKTTDSCRKNYTPAFNGKNHSAYDTFEKSAVKPEVQNNKTDSRGKFLQHAFLTDSSNHQKRAGIYQDKEKPNTFSIYLDGNPRKHKTPLCTIEMSNDEDCIYIDYISRKGKNNIKGAGTELIKFAAQTSISKGHGGKIRLLAIASLPFYYKNNFRAEKGEFSSEKNAYLSYITRNKSEICYSWPPKWCNVDLMLTRNAARALIQNEKFYTKEFTETECDKTLTYRDNEEEHKINIDIDLCETTNNSLQNKYQNRVAKEYIIQIIQKSDEDILPIGVLKMNLLEDSKNKKYLNIKNIHINKHHPVPNCIDLHDKIKDLLLTTARKKMKTLGANYIKYQSD